jgi:hypothetical protein
MIEGGLGSDQAAAVIALGAEGSALRALLSPASHGKTTTLAMGAHLAMTGGRDAIGLATTNQGVAELERVGIPALIIAMMRAEARTLRPGTIVILDEVSQVATADAEVIAWAVVATPGASLWCAGDAAETAGRGNLSAVVAELDEAMEDLEPSPLERSFSARFIQDRSHELDRLSSHRLHRDYGHDLGLGR